MFEMLVRGLVTGLSIGAAAMTLLVFLLASACAVIIVRAASKKKGGRKKIIKKWWKNAVKKAREIIAARPTLLVEFLAVTGGWLFFLFVIFILLAPAWQWFLAHPSFFWMPLVVFIAVRALHAFKKKPADYLGYAIILVLAIAFALAIPWGESGKSDMASLRPAETAPAQYASISTPLSWAGCEPLPSHVPEKIGMVVSQTLYAPVGVESRCYIIRDGYRSRMALRAPLRIRWQNGTVLNLSPDQTRMIGLGTVWYAAFVISSNGNTPAELIMRFEKYAQ